MYIHTQKNSNGPLVTLLQQPGFCKKKMPRTHNKGTNVWGMTLDYTLRTSLQTIFL